MAANTWQWDDKYDTPRDLIGYGPNPPHPQWPNDAVIAVSFVINYEEGGEYSVLNGDDHSESYLCEVVGSQPRQRARNTNIETEYEYGSRAGIWRLLRLFEGAGFKGTVYGVGKAMEANPEVASICQKMQWEVASHGWRWIDYHDMPKDKEREEVEKCIDLIQQQTGQAPRGWYVGRLSPHSRTLLHEIYKERNLPLLWHSDNYSDDLPFWKKLPEVVAKDEASLIIPYSLDCNDMKFAMPNNWSSPEDFFKYMKGAFDTLYTEGLEGCPKMMSIGLHCRLSGRPGRIGAVKQFVEYISGRPGVWVATREEIAKHWMETHPYDAKAVGFSH